MEVSYSKENIVSKDLVESGKRCVLLVMDLRPEGYGDFSRLLLATNTTKGGRGVGCVGGGGSLHEIELALAVELAFLTLHLGRGAVSRKRWPSQHPGSQRRATGCAPRLPCAARRQVSAPERSCGPPAAPATGCRAWSC
jgi:hypothetical protein